MLLATSTLFLLSTVLAERPNWSRRQNEEVSFGESAGSLEPSASTSPAVSSTSEAPTSSDASAMIMISTSMESASSAAALSAFASSSVSSMSMNASSTANSASTNASATGNTAAAAVPTPTGDYVTLPFPYPLDTSQQGKSAYISDKWATAHQKARSRLASWTQEEKVNLTTGAGWTIGRCVGNIPEIPTQGFPGLCLEDSPLGVRFADFVSAFPAGINVASTFDKDLMYKRGYAMGQEHKGKGVNIALGPMTNMGRVAAGGRNWEGFGADPYLSGWGSEETVKGMQDAGVQACVKHLVGNEQEHFRTTSSSDIDDRTMREIYTHPFLRAVAADVASVMCSYNLVNGSWACQNPQVLNKILKTELGFQGFVMSDWQATMSGVSSVNSGLDMTMPGDIVFNSLTSYFGQNLTMALNNGSVASNRLDDMAERIMAAYYLVGQDDPNYPAVNFDAFRISAPENNTRVNVQADHYKLIEEIAAASTVLLKNDNNALPLHKPKSIALIGEDMGPSIHGPNGCSDRGCDMGTLAMGWGSGTAEFPYLIDPLTAIATQARKDGTGLNWWLDDWNLDGIANVARPAEVAIVGINADSGEQYITVDGNEGDRNNLTAWLNGDAIVQATAAVNNNTIVVVHSVGPIVMEAWIENPNITAVLWAGLPGQETGNGLVDVLYGWYNPSARLPYTIAKAPEDYPAQVLYESSEVEPQIVYSEGLNIDYRHFMAKNITPRFEFGYGLSYTTFNYYDVQIWQNGGKRWQDENGNVTVGGHLTDELQRPRWTVQVQIQNVGAVDGCEIPQLYLEYPTSAGEPPRVLRDFAKLNLQPGANNNVQFTLSQYDVSIWDVPSQSWVVPDGEFTVVVAKSSLDQGVTTTFCPGNC